MDDELDFVQYLRQWASVNPNDQTIRDLHRSADEIERLRSQNTELIKMFKQVGVVAEMWQKSEDELIELHHGKCAEQFAKQADEIGRLREEVARLTLLSNLWESEFVAAVDEIKRLGKS